MALVKQLKKLSKDTYIYAMSKDNEPVMRVESGAVVEIETYDCFLDQIKSEDTPFNEINWDQVNPATGPIYVEEAEPGDILKVEIKKIELVGEGTLATGPQLGVLGERLSEFKIKKVPIQDGKIVFNEKLSFPLTPMVGVIGVAPKEGAVNCGTPGDHGGNLDTTLVKEGATLYFPVFHPGALFALGDVHAAMGDGEVGVSGVEIAAKITVSLTVVKGESIPTPFVENEEGFATLVTKETLDEAAKGAVEAAADLIAKRTDLDMADIAMLLSAVGDLQISQVVNPLKTARMFVPKAVLEGYGGEKLF